MDAASQGNTELAAEAARAIHHDPNIDSPYEPCTPLEAEAAVEALGLCFRDTDGTSKQMRRNAMSAAEGLSTDRFQGLIEVVQNANDVGARNVRIILQDEDLYVIHDGRPLCLKDVHALSAPYITTKRDNSSATGRFGIGLMSLYSLADDWFEMHDPNYHIRFRREEPENTGSLDVPATFASPTETVLWVPLTKNPVDPSELLKWFSHWDDHSLLFMDSVSAVSVTTTAGELNLRLDQEFERNLVVNIGGEEAKVALSTASSDDGRIWHVYRSVVSSPPDLSRANKSTAPKTPIGLAFSDEGQDDVGELFAGLPVEKTQIPLFVNAQFDPATGRQQLLDNNWNQALVPLLADLWQGAVSELFVSDAPSGWSRIPVGLSNRFDDSKIGTQLANAILERSLQVSSQIIFNIGDAKFPLAELAVESVQLKGLLTPSEIAALAGTPAALPNVVRDSQGAWRDVIDYWRSLGSALPPELRVADALSLLPSELRSVESTIALTAAALTDGLATELKAIDCVIRADLRRIAPPLDTDPHAFTESNGGLATTLGIGILVHRAYSSGDTNSVSVREWMLEKNYLLPTDADQAILGRLAKAGYNDTFLPDILSDHQLVALRDAFENVDEDLWDGLGRGIGKAIHIRAFMFAGNAKRTSVSARPCQCYLPKTIDGGPESFASAAEATPGLLWANGSYSTVLKSERFRAGLGAQKFLGILGAETSPRLIPHPGNETKYNRYEAWLPAHYRGSPPERTRALQDLGADHTFKDLDSPDLIAVLHDISKEKKARTRRERARAVLALLGRARSELLDRSEVPAKRAQNSRLEKGTVRAWWAWQAATIPWLDDSSATPTSPIKLRMQTPANVAVSVPESSRYLHPEFKEVRADALRILGVPGEPTTNDLIVKLRGLRDTPPSDNSTVSVATSIYEALAIRLSTKTAGSRVELPQLIRDFNSGNGLVLTTDGWKRPADVLRGNPIFRTRRVFTPNIPNTESLWNAIQIRSAQIVDCVGVLTEISKSNSKLSDEDEVVILETLRLLTQLLDHSNPTPTEKRALSKLPLWTTQGWKPSKSAYLVDDPALAEELANRIPVWQPGGDAAQFVSLRVHLKFQIIASSAGIVVEDASARPNDDLTDDFRDVVRHLKQDLSRNAETTANALTISWDALEEFEIYTAPLLRVRVTELPGNENTLRVSSKADAARARIYVDDDDNLWSASSGGQAVASLFESDRRQVSQAWLGAVEKSKEGKAASLRLSAEVAQAEAKTAEDLLNRTEKFQSGIFTRATKPERTAKGPEPSNAPKAMGIEKDPKNAPAPKARVLVELENLIVVNPEGTIVLGDADSPLTQVENVPSTSKPGPNGGKPLPPPRKGGASIQPKSTFRSFTPEECERRGLEIARMVLRSDDDRMIDLRGQKGVGADAIDEMDNYYELKVFGREEQDTIKLEPAQIQRALSTPNFFLVIVSGVEEGGGNTKVRIIVDPISQLQMKETSIVKFSGVQRSTGIVFDLPARTDGDVANLRKWLADLEAAD